MIEPAQLPQSWPTRERTVSSSRATHSTVRAGPFKNTLLADLEVGYAEPSAIFIT